MTSRVAAIVFRLAFAALSLTAVFVQFFAVTVARGFSIPNFFCYFTNLSNILISIVFIVSALRLLRGRTDPSDSMVAIRGGAVVYIVFVGIVFSAILGDGDIGPVIPWVNVVVHMIVPAAGFLDWLIWAPRRRLPFRVVLWWMIWPAVFSIFSVARGAVDGFYPYPFYNPDVSGGYGGVALWCAALVVVFFLLAVLIRWVGNLRQRSLTQQDA
ncbi:Pr6Pr family membrane protein [Microbacterium sp.]|uniref:Pr6Pr family membrane protein n=1 Tax=Microbacterium sp. TaxID=51671 RepID=UPI002FE11DC2